MFTGLVQERAVVLASTLRAGGLTLLIARPSTFENLKDGESIAADGVCLTLENSDRRSMKFFVGAETLKVTTFGDLSQGKSINLERSLAFGDRVGGHLVSGHIDGVARVVSAEKVGSCLNLQIRTPREFVPFLVPKGSVCLNGVSLTINTVSSKENAFAVLLIPETLVRTNLSELTEGSALNLECDSTVKTIIQHLKNMENEGTLRELNP